MKAEINNENKARFFAQYWGQDVLCSDMYGDGGTIYSATMKDSSIKKEWLSLKSLSDISDEDAIEAIKTHYDGDRDEMIDKSKDRYMKNARAYILSPIQCILPSVVDFLRSRGYLVPFMGLSCEEIIEAGWAKLKE